MSSRLASLLVHDGHVAAARMSEAFQRQVIYGGTLDTILLEMGLVDEMPLLEGLGRASGLPTLDEVPPGDLGPLAAVVPIELSERFQVVPLSVRPGRLQVAVTLAFDTSQLDRVGTLLDQRIEALIAPEYLYYLVRERVYGHAVPARWAALWDKVRPRHELALMARRVQQREDEDRVNQQVADALEWQRSAAHEVAPPTTAGPTIGQPQAPPSAAAEVERAPSQPPTPPSDVVPATAALPVLLEGAPDTGPDEDDVLRFKAVGPLLFTTDEATLASVDAEGPVAQEGAVIEAVAPEITDVTPAAAAEAASAHQATMVAPESATRSLPPSQPRPDDDAVPPLVDEQPTVALRAAPHAADAAAMPAPLTLVQGLAVLEEATDRDAIFDTLCRIARGYFEMVVLFAVQQERAVPRLAMGTVRLERDSLVQCDVPLDTPSALRTTVTGLSMYVGQLGNEPVLEHALHVLGRPTPVWGALFPIVLRERSAAVLYGDVGGKQLDAAALADINRAVAEAARALQRIILRSKSGRITLQGTGPAMPVEVPSSLNPMAVLSARPELIRMVQRVALAHPDSQQAASALLGAGEAGALALAVALPGPLRMERMVLAPPTAPLATYGPLLALVSSFGRTLVPHLLPRLSEADAHVRFYLTLAFSDLPYAEAVPHLGKRLFDPDVHVRHAAARALGHFPPSPEGHTLIESLRQSVSSVDARLARMAIEALGELRDVVAVPRLIEHLGSRDAEMLAAVERALTTITCQHFGPSRWRWRSWWEENRGRSRIDWLLDGLGHSEATIRQAASDELQTMTSERFGYHQTLPRQTREAARQRWLAWYKQQAVESGGPVPDQHP